MSVDTCIFFMKSVDILGYSILLAYSMHSLLSKRICFSFSTNDSLTVYLIEAHFNAFANRADQDQAALKRAA